MTTTSDTQGAQGSAVAASHINGWDQPLLPRDDRPLAAGEKAPFWDKDPIEMRDIDLMGGAASSSTAPQPKAMPKRCQDQRLDPGQPERLLLAQGRSHDLLLQEKHQLGSFLLYLKASWRFLLFTKNYPSQR